MLTLPDDAAPEEADARSALLSSRSPAYDENDDEPRAPRSSINGDDEDQPLLKGSGSPAQSKGSESTCCESCFFGVSGCVLM